MTLDLAPGSTEEAALVERARSDPDAFGELYDRYLPRVYRFAYSRTRSHAAAEDVTARTFHQALESLPRYEWRGVPFSAWLFRIAANAAVDAARRDGRTASLDRLMEDGFAPMSGLALPESAAVRAEEVDLAWAAVAELPSMQGRAVTLYFAHGLSHAEVGRRIGRSESATKQLVYRAIKTLRSRLAHLEGDVS